MTEPIIRDYNKKTHKKCIKCRGWKLREDLLSDSTGQDDEIREVLEKRGFGRHRDSGDGLASICIKCKNKPAKEQRNKNVRARIRHHIATRCTTQLGDHAPDHFVRDLEIYLGYRIVTLVTHLRADLHKREGPLRKLRDALEDGYHIDHIRPLSLWADELFDEIAGSGEIEINWNAFQECWNPQNLTAIPASENLAKGAKYEGVSPDIIIHDDLDVEFIPSPSVDNDDREEPQE